MELHADEKTANIYEQFWLYEKGHCALLGETGVLSVSWQNPLHYPNRTGPCPLRTEQRSTVESFLLNDSSQTHSCSAPIGVI